MLSRFYPIPGRYGRTERQTDGRTDRIAVSISRVIVLTRDNKKRIIPAIITGRITSFFLLLYYSLCWLDSGPPYKNVVSKVGGGVLQKVGGSGTPDPPVVASLNATHGHNDRRHCVKQFVLKHAQINKPDTNWQNWELKRGNNDSLSRSVRRGMSPEQTLRDDVNALWQWTVWSIVGKHHWDCIIFSWWKANCRHGNGGVDAIMLGLKLLTVKTRRWSRVEVLFLAARVFVAI